MKSIWAEFFLVALLIALPAAHIAQKLDLDKDIELDVTGELVGNTLITYLTPFLGRSVASADSSQKTPLIVDLTFDKVMIANKEGSDYGITCHPDLYCEITGAKDVCTYQKVSAYDCQQGSVLVKYKEAKVNDHDISQMTVFFYNSSQFWETNYGRHGVFGLSPGSPVWNYFEAAYNKQPGQDYVETSLSYAVRNYKNAVDQTKAQFYDSFLTVNGRAGINDPVMQTFSKNKYSQWVFEGATITYNSSNSTKTNVCVDNTQHVYFLSSRATQLRSSIFQKLCGKTTGCTRANSNLDNLGNLQIKFESGDSKKFTMDVKPQEYVNFDSKDVAQIAIDDIGNSKCGSLGAGVTEGIGRLMLTKVEFVVRVMENKGLEIGFNEISYPKDTVFLIILIVLGAVILLIIIGIVIASSISKKKATEEENERYHKQEDNDN